MLKRLLGVAAVVAVASASLRAQTPSKPSGASASSAPSASSTEKYTPHRTPWGDPDLQGNYTNKYEYGTPFERPAEFEGRRIDDVTAQELAAVVNKRQQDTLDRAKFLGGDPEGRIGNSAEFRDIYEVS